MNVCAPGVRTGGGDEKHMVFELFCTSAYPRRVSRSFCWAPHDAILYESGRSEEYYSLYLCMPGLQQTTWWALYSDPSVGQRSWIVLVYELTLSHCVCTARGDFAGRLLVLILFIYFFCSLLCGSGRLASVGRP